MNKFQSIPLRLVLVGEWRIFLSTAESDRDRCFSRSEADVGSCERVDVEREEAVVVTRANKKNDHQG